MISTPALRASTTVQCGAGWVSGTPGASTSAAIVRQSASRKSCVLQASRLRLAKFLFVVVEDDNLGAARGKRARRQQARTAEAEDGDCPTRERGDGDQ